ncbi:VOC family protein [Virgisporangium ochraceum]|uniref:Cysteine transferase n=1 Tax=Virgisporangium ochraceum TaxID=65505 RepID=A0A8J4EF11_9ACTN|nr:VOC family protein [Virgisporangium ochraceum]GIJ73180.1 cysteine transferase [Virgisporangium ochraceum]
MPVQFNHTIVHVRDRERSAQRLAELLGLAAPVPYGPFLVIELSNNISLDFIQDDRTIHPQHYAFLVSDAEFDEILARIKDHGLPYWADPLHRQPGRINTNDGGRGLYWADDDGHNLEIITVPYGGWPSRDET